jgi:hypothetical protein
MWNCGFSVKFTIFYGQKTKFADECNNENETVRKEGDHMQSARGSMTLLKTAWTSDEHAR